jgi:branched-chain amino acid aminotransferase
MHHAHTVTAKQVKPLCWKNGAVVGAEHAVVSIYDHGLLYGDGCFEGLRFYGGQPFRLGRHLSRLRRSLSALDIQISYSDDELQAGIAECIEQSNMPNGYLRLLVTRGEGDMGLNPQHCVSPNVFIIPASLSLVSDDTRQRGVSLITSSVKRAVGTGLDSRVKSLNYLHSILARAEANAAGVDEAILLNQFGFVAECSAENIFIVSGGNLLTPPIKDGALEGVSREIILSLAADKQLPHREQSLTTYDLYNADECFICGSGAGLIPVRQIDGRIISQCPGAYYQSMSAGYQALIKAECFAEGV